MDLWVLIYSKFSHSCQELLTVLDQNDIGIDFNLLSIDDKAMRDRIMKDKRFNIKFVPCILNVNQLSGVVSQYEADKAFELIYSQIALIQESEMERQSEIQQQLRFVQPPLEPNTSIEKQLEIESQYIPSQEPEQKHTAISDLIDDEEEQEEEYIKKPVIPERQDTGNSIKKRINVGEIMNKSKKEMNETPPVARTSYNPSGIDISKGPPEPIKSIKAGSPISVSEIMAQAGKDNQKN
jgi:hypothetical protein